MKTGWEPRVQRPDRAVLLGPANVADRSNRINNCKENISLYILLNVVTLTG